MTKNRTEIEWHVLDEQIEGRPAATFPESTAALPSHNPRSKLYIFAASVLLFITVGGVWLWYQAERGIEQVETELQGVAQAELWVAANHDIELAIDLVADPLAPAWHRQFGRDDSTLAMLQSMTPDVPLAVDLEVVELEDAWAKVLMTVGEAGRGVMVRQTRFYRKSTEGWLRTAPSTERWGEPDSLELEYFVLHFRQHDAAAVGEVAAKLDTLYLSLWETLGLDTLSGDTKLMIEISPTQVPGEAILPSSAVDRFVVPSPSLYLAPVSVTDADLILQSIALQIVPAAVDEAIADNQILWVREHVINALQLWLIWDMSLPLSSWRHDIVPWRLEGLNSATQGEAIPLPTHYVEFCVRRSLWIGSPTLLSIPLNCNELDHIPMVTPPPDPVSNGTLEQLSMNIFWPGSSPIQSLETTVLPGDATILTTLFEFIVSRYGRERLPILLEAFGQHKSWTTLSQVVFGLSSSEFASEWWEYVDEEYQLSQ